MATVLNFHCFDWVSLSTWTISKPQSFNVYINTVLQPCLQGHKWKLGKCVFSADWVDFLVSRQLQITYMFLLSASPRCLTSTREARVLLSNDREPVGMVTWNVGWVGAFFPVMRGDVSALQKGTRASEKCTWFCCHENQQSVKWVQFSFCYLSSNDLL